MKFTKIVLCTAGALRLQGSLAVWQVQHLQTLSRHGERGPLFKDPFTNKENLSLTGKLTALTTTGEFQCFMAGQAFRKRYLAPDAPLPLPAVSTLTLDKLTLDSSDTARTLASATSFFYGVYPPAGVGVNSTLLQAWSPALQTIPYGLVVAPISSLKEANDIFIRAYQQCPIYSSELTALYNTPGFAAFQSSHQPYFNQLQAIMASNNLCNSTLVAGQIVMANLYNIYDCLQTEDRSTVIEILGQDSFNQVLWIADWLEQQRYSPEVIGRRLGGNLLGAMISEMDAFISGKSMIKWHHHSTHYPTQKSVLAALGLSDAVYGIPNYACMFNVELMQDSANITSWAVRFVFQNGSDADYLPLMFPNATKLPQDSQGTVLYSDLKAYIMSTGATYPTISTWCNECNNTASDVCLNAQLVSLKTKSTL